MIIRGVKMNWLYIGIALGGFWFGNTLTAALYTTGYKINDFKMMDKCADHIRFISLILTIIFISIWIVW